ncbi:sulfur carrier protein ThiS [Acidithiobacillus sp. AMEEHan]|uniref:sulfur carrier protein ThiS n=1 Tax=Acidithiobacillus sp. AMEEHan TaxID=2994951 RepID=UPI0027E4F568|nr:sulfur carrier protein ThiS [Acidithiobacillus sp. AMEEHan]
MAQEIVVQVNGAAYVLPEDSNILTLLNALGLSDQRVAVERNGTVVPRSQHADTRLLGGDKLEVIRAVGGG